MSTKRHRQYPRLRQRGLTLIELTMFIVIMGVAMAGILGVMDRFTRQSGDPLQRKQAILRAEAVLEEIALANITFCHPDDAKAETATASTTGTEKCATLPENFGPRAGESRPYLNVNDYVTGAGAETSFTTDANGNALQPAGYTTTVTIKPIAGFGPSGAQIGGITAPVSADSDVLHISVKVVYAGGTIVLDRYRTRYAPTSMP